MALSHCVWNECIVLLTDEPFTRKVDDSVRSLRNHNVLRLSSDDRWCGGLRGEPVPGVCALVTAGMRDEPPVMAVNDRTPRWQILVHVASHGTNHRAQMLMLLKQIGIKTFPQESIGCLWKQR